MGHRLLKVNEALREVLSAEIASLKDPRIGFVTVTGVEVSSDLRHAKVYVSVMGRAKDRERTLAGLRAAHGHLQDRIAADVRIKRTPQLTFHYDESIDRGQRIETLLKRYEGELGEADEAADDRAPGADEAGPDEPDAASGGSA
ncbi:MAG TPA: 30S ribosome-binding factor RbfA [Thermoleophilia bacterium]|nr:30S ribosome-binding factor RbfA [Thermoleophilia bacterium]